MIILSLLGTSCSISGLDLQEDYPYKATTLNPKIHKTARQYLEERGKNPVRPNDTIFKWMQLGLEYAEIDLAEYEKPGRTFVFLSNNAIRVRNATSGAITAGMWFTFPKMVKNPDGSQKMNTNGTPATANATKWSDYPKADVRNYFLYLIALGDFGFHNAKIANTTLPTLLPANQVASNITRLGYYVAGTTPNYTPAGARILTSTDFTVNGNGFDPEGKINFNISNSDYAPLMVNDLTTFATSGIEATNGQIHVSSTVVYPWRY